MIDGMGSRVDMHGWSEGGRVVFQRQSDRNSE